MNATWHLAAVAAASMLATLLGVPLARRLALRVGLVDDPGSASYKSHRKVTPYGGGLAMYAACLLPGAGALIAVVYETSGLLRDGSGWISPWAPYWVTPFGNFPTTVVEVSQVAALFACASVVWVVGMVDDFRGLSPLFRLAAQLGVAILLAGWIPGFRLPIAGAEPLVSAALSAFWIASITNAFNMLDNMEGLAAGVAAIALSGLVSLSLACGHVPAALLGLLVIGAACGFLVFNFPRATVFMGDSGALFLGFVAGGLSVLVTGRLAETPAFDGTAVLLSLLVLAVPAYDLASVVAIRLSRRIPPWHGDQNHTSHRLVRLGLSRRDSVLVLYGATAAAVWGTLLLTRASIPTAVAIAAAVALLVAAIDFAAFRRGGNK
ncbi:MAG: MraY family glycosyltransferase [Gemmatimonadetes bacterium]|nr:MraY family glycosyltransferase [Gemmatimonadota bacterium]